jgi:hypothetical protein
MLIKIIITGMINFAIGSFVALLLKSTTVFDIAYQEKLKPLLDSDIMRSPSFQMRNNTFRTFAVEIFSSLKFFLIGSFQTTKYVETDSAFLNLAYNFGTPVFLAWLIYFIVPVFFVAVSFNEIRKRKDFNTCMTFMLSIFLVSSMCTHFWIQYLPEKFPACLFIGFALSYILINALQLKHSNNEIPE